MPPKKKIKNGKKRRQVDLKRKKNVVQPTASCGSKCQTKLGRLRKLNRELSQEVAMLRKFERDCNDYNTMFHRYIIKFSQCVPRVVNLKKRLEESYDILLDVENLVTHFADGNKLTKYLLGNETFQFESEPSKRKSSLSNAPGQSPLAKERPQRDRQRFDEELETIHEANEEPTLPVNLQKTFENIVTANVETESPDLEALRKISTENVCTDRRSARRSTISIGEKRNSKKRESRRTRGSSVPMQPLEEVPPNRNEVTARAVERAIPSPLPMQLETMPIEPNDNPGRRTLRSSSMMISEFEFTPKNKDIISSETPDANPLIIPTSTPVENTPLKPSTSTPASEVTQRISPPRVSMIFKENIEKNRRRRKAIIMEQPDSSGFLPPPRKQSLARKSVMDENQIQPKNRKTVVFEEPSMIGKTFVKPPSTVRRSSLKRRTFVKSTPSTGIVLNEISSNCDKAKDSPQAKRSKSSKNLSLTPEPSDKGRRSTRTIKKVSYVEPTLNKKMRRCD